MAEAAPGEPPFASSAPRWRWPIDASPIGQP